MPNQAQIVPDRVALDTCKPKTLSVVNQEHQIRDKAEYSPCSLDYPLDSKMTSKDHLSAKPKWFVGKLSKYSLHNILC